MKEFHPRTYQEMIMDHIILHPRCMVWAGMGMGKTVSTLTAIRFIRYVFGDGKVLIIAPLRVATSTWPDEVAKWKHLASTRVSVISGTAKQKLAAIEADADIYCTNFETIPLLEDHWKWDIVVVDEATRLKGYRLQSGSKRAHLLEKLSRNCHRFIELTGTPAPNGLIDLWGQAYFIDRGQRLGRTMGVFTQRWFHPTQVGREAYMVRYDPLPGADHAIKTALADVALTVNAEDWFPIEKPIINEIAIDLPVQARKSYKELERQLLTYIGSEEVEAVNAGAKLMKCLQLASGAIYDSEGSWVHVHDEKVKALESVIEEAAGMPVLVSYQFRHEAERVLEKIKGARLLDTNPQTIRDWNAGKIPVLLAHPAACGHGLNLQDGGNILCFLSVGYNLEHYLQMCERIGPTRQAQAGHPRPVFIHHIVAKDTVDQQALRALRDKRSLLDVLLGRASHA